MTDVIWIVTLFLLLEFLVSRMRAETARDWMLSPAMMQNAGIRKGLPLYGHGGYWGDLLLISPLCAGLWGSFHSRWNLFDWTVTAACMCIANTAMHWLWARSKLPDCFACNGKLTNAGKIHWFYMWICLTILGMFYFHTTGVAASAFWIISGIVLFHEFIANHKALNAVQPHWWPRMSPKDAIQGWVTIAVVFALIFWRKAYVTGH